MPQKYLDLLSNNLCVGQLSNMVSLGYCQLMAGEEEKQAHMQASLKNKFTLGHVENGWHGDQGETG